MSTPEPTEMDSHETQTRRVVRALFTKESKSLEDLLKGPDPGRSAVTSKLNSLTSRYQRLVKADTEIEEKLIGTPDISDDVLANELEKSGEYGTRYSFVKDLAEQYLEQHHAASSQSGENAEGSVLNQDVSAYLKHTFKPEITRIFDGNIANWIGFWTQFEKIHKSDKWSEDDKFEILLKGLKPDSPAAKLIARFPPSTENYTKAVDLLCARYGKDEFLIEFYVRKLLSLVLTKSENRSISELLDDLEVQLNGLDSLKVAKDKYAAFLFPLVESAVPDSVFKIWERHRVSKNASMAEPTDCLTELLNFLRIEVSGEERLKLRSCDFGEKPANSPPGEDSTHTPSAAALVSTFGQPKSVLCVFCDRNHPSADCVKSGDLTLGERNALVKRKRACFRCLRTGHLSEKCRAYIRCFVCKGRHYPIMCNKISSDSTQKDSEAASAATSEVETKALVAGYRAVSVVYLQTLVAKVVSAGAEFTVRILIDSGSQRSYILKSRVNEFKLQRHGKTLVQQELFGGQKTALKSHALYKVSLKSTYGPFQCEFEVLDQERICGFVPKVTDTELYESLRCQGIILSDYSCSSVRYEDIDILLGADALPQIFTDQVVRLENNMIAVNTKLGWSVMGSSKEKSTVSAAMLVTLVSQAHLSHFWDLETLGIKDPAVKKTQAEKDRQVNDFFKETVTRNEDGRYIVRLPWIEGFQDLEENRDVAHKRLISTTKRLKNYDKYEDYDSVIQEWVKKGIVEVVPDDQVEGKGHYLPHRAVFKEHSTTKVRPVFDASSQDKDGRSLNGCLEKGPNQIELIPNVITNWRQYPIGVSSDIEKAFLVIQIASEDRDWLRFLWWHKGKVVTLRHCRVVFGVSPSPYLLSAVLKHHLENPPPHLEATALKLLRSFYVDNSLTGVESEEELLKFKKESQELLESAGFNLRGWASNLDTENREENVLGLLWDCGLDTVGCNMKLIDGIPASLTRRTLLSSAHRLYDPIGFTEPTKLMPRIILQKAHDVKKGWDDPLNIEAAEEFKDWLNEVHLLKDCRIPRRIFLNASSSVHVFCDASKIAFATCIFVRTEWEGRVEVNLLMAKARVAPKESPTLPRLELLAALAGVRLYSLARQGLNQEAKKIYFWTDSSVVLAWITHFQQWSIFVQNRVTEIREFTTTDQWRHIPGTDNPADLLSRGCSPSRLLESKWWEGPSWLRLPESQWPVSHINPPVEEVMQERKRTVIAAAVASSEENTFPLTNLANRISDYFRIVKVVVHVLDAICILAPSFILHCGLDETNVLKRGFSSCKFLNAEIILMRAIQLEYFDLNREKSALKGFSVFHDDRGLLRVKSRVLDSGNPDDFNRPIVLPGKHPLVVRMIEHLHVNNHHAGVLTLLMIIREKIWLICGRQAVSKVVRKCITCRKNAAKALEVPVAPLPTDRTKPSAPFQVIGVDLAGPLFLKNQGKAWVVIFTCAVYRAVHLELVSALSTEAFIQALRRFIARRGRPSVIYSDNGTNFVGLDNLFQQIDWAKMEEETSVQKIQWKFNPPSAPWWGGFWERLVRVLKDLLRKNLGCASLNHEEMRTMLCECESVINNRPLTYVSEDPSELAPLRPAMFIQSLAHNDVDDLDLIESNDLEKNWKYLSEVRDGLKKRFSKEYLGILRASKPNRTDTLEIGDIVLIGSDNKKRLDWPLGKVIELSIGRDGITRLAKLKTKNGEALRPLQRLYPLEIRGEVLESHPDLETVPGVRDDGHQGDAASTSNEDLGLEITETPRPPRERQETATEDPNIAEDRPRHTKSGRAVRAPKFLDL